MLDVDEWQPIGDAPKESGIEILGVRYHNGKMTKEPFITFWSPTLHKFYVDPTHWVKLPDKPKSS